MNKLWINIVLVDFSTICVRFFFRLGYCVFISPFFLIKSPCLSFVSAMIAKLAPLDHVLFPLVSLNQVQKFSSCLKCKYAHVIYCLKCLCKFYESRNKIIKERRLETWSYFLYQHYTNLSKLFTVLFWKNSKM